MGNKLWGKSASAQGIVDVAHLMRAFEEMNQVKLELSFTIEQPKGHWELMGKVTAWSREPAVVDQPLLGSRSVICSATNLQTVEAVAIHLLYMLDGFLAQQEAALTSTK